MPWKHNQAYEDDYNGHNPPRAPTPTPDPSVVGPILGWCAMILIGVALGLMFGGPWLFSR